LKLDNIFIHFKNYKVEDVFRVPEQFKAYKENANLNEDINLVIGDLGFARELGPQ